MTAQKLLVGCVAVAALAAFVMVPYTWDKWAGVICVAVAAVCALLAFSAKFAAVVDSAGKSPERFLIRRNSAALSVVLALLGLWKGQSIAEAFGLRFAFYVFWPLVTGWLSYKTVRALLRPPPLA